MKWRNPDQERPYYSKYQKLQVENHRDWFQVYQLPGHVIAICEPQHLQEVNVFLIFGEEKVLMMDSGMGICDIRPLVEELCAREDELHGKEGGSYFSTLEVVNCHCHFDHTGNNWRFGQVWGAADPVAEKQAARGVPCAPLANQSDEDMFLQGYPEGFVPSNYCVRPYRYRICQDGQIFHLGERDVEFINTPGHTEDHAMLFDHRFGILFAGDMIYFGAIYVQFDNDVMGHSDIQDYIDSLDKVRFRCPDMRAIYVSHNDFVTDKAAITEIRDALTAVRDGTAEGEPLQDEKYGYFQDPPTMRQYQFDGFSIVAGK